MKAFLVFVKVFTVMNFLFSSAIKCSLTYKNVKVEDVHVLKEDVETFKKFLEGTEVTIEDESEVEVIRT